MRKEMVVMFYGKLNISMNCYFTGDRYREKTMQYIYSNIRSNGLVSAIGGFIAAVGSICILLFSGTIYAADITVFVDGRSGPWDITVNPTYSYGMYNSVNLPPTSVSSASGLSFAVGNTLKIEYSSGLANAGGPGIYNDANGAWVSADVAYGGFTPGYYIPGDNNLEQLLGVYADSNGVIVGSPFTIGNGPVLSVIPVGATQLLMGFNDIYYNDNGAGLYMKVSGLPVIVDSTAPVLTMPNLADSYPLGSSIVLTFSATDAQSQIASISATLNGILVSSGSAVTLNQLGTYTFALAATDTAGNTASQTQQFIVSYDFGGDKSQSKCNQGVGNGPEGCDPGKSYLFNPFRSNDENSGIPGKPGRRGGNK